jgi:demethylmenaquinone methyltransferase/2-methoxy-6-polyprenyl-1,4-benzoquinol methylase
VSDKAGIDELLAEQRAYYRLRAPGYDEWWQRRGRYERGDDEVTEWNRQLAVVEAALAEFDRSGDVLEIAGGTGWWTQYLAATASTLTVVDASIEMLQRNKARAPDPHVHRLVADVFTWQPRRRYDAVFFSFWLSHVPRSRLDAFWGLVGSCLRPGGRVFLIDNRLTDPTEGRRDPYVLDYETDIQVRHLGDGTTQHRVVKVMYEPDELQARLETLGWKADIAATPWFIYGVARP